MTHYQYKIDADWFERRTSPSEIARNLHLIMAAVQKSDPTIENWAVQTNEDLEGPNPTASVASFGSKFADYVAEQVDRDDWDQPDPDGGYSVCVVTNAYPLKPADGFSQSVFVNAGSIYSNTCKYDVGNSDIAPDPSLVTFPRFLEIQKAMISIWQPAWAITSCSRWGEGPPIQPGDPPFPGNLHQMPWFIYLSPEKAAGVAAPSYVQTERAPDGGLILIAADTRFEPLDPDHMRASRALAEILLAQGIWQASSR